MMISGYNCSDCLYSVEIVGPSSPEAAEALLELVLGNSATCPKCRGSRIRFHGELRSNSAELTASQALQSLSQSAFPSPAVASVVMDEGSSGTVSLLLSTGPTEGRTYVEGMLLKETGVVLRLGPAGDSVVVTDIGPEGVHNAG